MDMHNIMGVVYIYSLGDAVFYINRDNEACE